MRRKHGRNVATVFGGSGFIGRYVVKRLAAAGYMVRVAGRDPDAALFLQAQGEVGQIVPLDASSRDDAPRRSRAVEGADLVVNLVGILHERKPAISSVSMPRAPARSRGSPPPPGSSGWCISRRSAPTPPARATTRGPRRRARRRCGRPFPSATILRPSVVFGPEDEFFNRFAAMAQLLPVMPVIGGGKTRFQPVYVGDVADAVMAAARARPMRSGQTYELGGPRLTFREMLRFILETTRPPPAADRHADGAGAAAGRAARVACPSRR